MTATLMRSYQLSTSAKVGLGPQQLRDGRVVKQQRCIDGVRLSAGCRPAENVSPCHPRLGQHLRSPSVPMRGGAHDSQTDAPAPVSGDRDVPPASLPSTIRNRPAGVVQHPCCLRPSRLVVGKGHLAFVPEVSLVSSGLAGGGVPRIKTGRGGYAGALRDVPRSTVLMPFLNERDL